MIVANYTDAVGSVNKWGQGTPLGRTFVEATNKYGEALVAGSVVAFRYHATTGKLEAFKDAAGLASTPRTVGIAVGTRAEADGKYSNTIPEDDIGVFQISGFCERVLAAGTTASNKHLSVIKDTNEAGVGSSRGTATFGIAIGSEVAADGDAKYVAAQLYGLPVITSAS